MNTPGFVRPAAGICALVAVSVLTRPTGQAQVANALPFSKSYTITGNYVVGGVDLKPSSKGKGFITGTIPMSEVPANADIVAAFLYWETIWSDKAQVDGARFRGLPIVAVKASSTILDKPSAQCAGGGGNSTKTLTMYKVDAGDFKPIKTGEFKA